MSLLLALVLTCKPVDQHPFTAKGNTKRGLTLEVKLDRLTLKERDEPLWRTEQSGFAVMFAADDSWVALKGPYPTGVILIAETKKGTPPKTVDPLASLTPEERKRVPQTDCGASWFKAWKNDPKALRLTVDQGEAPPL
jgi:hypothetical protein